MIGDGDVTRGAGVGWALIGPTVTAGVEEGGAGMADGIGAIGLSTALEVIPDVGIRIKASALRI